MMALNCMHIFCLSEYEELHFFRENIIFLAFMSKPAGLSRSCYKKTYDSLNKRFVGGIPYSDHGAQITPLPSFLIFVYFFFLFLFQVSLVKGQVCPSGLGKRFSQGPAGLEPPKNKGEGFMLQVTNRGLHQGNVIFLAFRSKPVGLSRSCYKRPMIL